MLKTVNDLSAAGTVCKINWSAWQTHATSWIHESGAKIDSWHKAHNFAMYTLGTIGVWVGY